MSTNEAERHLKVLLVANVVKEHVLKFHVPTIRLMRERGWTVDVAASGGEEVPCCNRQIRGVWKRSPFTLDTLKGILQLRRIIDEGDYDIVYCHTPVGALVARLAAMKARKHGTKVVYFAHGFHFFKGAPLVNWLVYFPVEWVLARVTDLLIATNEEDYDRIRRLFPKKTAKTLLPSLGVNFDRLKVENPEASRKLLREEWNIPEDALVLVYVAELIPNKNQEMLLKTLAEVRKKRKNAYLLLVGPDHADGKYQALAKQMGLEDAVVFTGWRSDIGACLHAADICTASSIREGFGMNVVEAMYCGLPVVATDNRGHVSVIRDGENGFLVHVGDYEKMAQRVLELSADAQLREKFAQAEIAQYGTDVVPGRICDVLMQVK
ncbi:MAG: glycosyltransferase family 4 protein [Clostridia bacterium]|nr:glycosyltransferase family 4 protein [Clostridia bacterium]